MIENSTKLQSLVLERESSLVMSSHLGQWHMPLTSYLNEELAWTALWLIKT
jgi:hypothetical protein